MKRCQFCGWMNPDTSSTCVKCQQPLDASVSTSAASKKNDESAVGEQAVEPVVPAVAAEAVAAEAEAEEAAERMPRPSLAGKTQAWHKGTLMPKRHKGGHPAVVDEPRNADTEGRFSLMMMPDVDEDFLPYASKHEGHEVILNRANTEATNKTITGKEQARLVNIDNKWYLEDRSEMKTTFVRSSLPIELHSGDLILMGDRVFRFDDLNNPAEE